MKSPLILAALLLLPLCASAETVDLGTHGTLTIAVPKDWKLTSEKQADTGVNLTLLPPAGVNAQGLLNVVFVQKGQSAAKADVDEKVLNEAEQFVAMSVEKKKTLRKFALAGDAYGSYCVFTDASLVGKPPEKDNFKVVAIGILWFNDDVSAAVSLVSDDEKGPDFEAMLAAVSSASLTAK